jgi:hypothetical protein
MHYGARVTAASSPPPHIVEVGIEAHPPASGGDELDLGRLVGVGAGEEHVELEDPILVRRVLRPAGHHGEELIITSHQG